MVARGARNRIRSSEGSGRTYYGSGGSSQYRGGYKHGVYAASAPGQAPVNVTGTLESSLKVRMFPSGEGAAVRDAAFYALMLETGARGGGNPGTRMPINPKTGKRKRARGVHTKRVLEPRPFLSAELAEQQQSIDTRLRAAVTEGLSWKQTAPR